ncbi:tetratricopeptide repeat protein [Limibaculum sp. M0105]|uniref:Tetratricopeptide repeat protein n=1 Tax=Thermohalobaculum xanthum TaxID=2753746 RepID=A0A8J7SGQ7_9RHOB|nr:tetratricopeptide repeat protein [Thermohalobaculum xanthum]MBK0401116.1 tetratricopeptide repeat protein [Thermohalobaculum xanthum]
MRRLIFPAVALLGLVACGGSSGGGGKSSMTPEYLRICSDPQSTPEEALRFCQRALSDPRLDARQRALVQMNSGIALYALGRHRDAVSAFSEALSLSPGLAGALVGRAQAQEALGDQRAAMVDYSAAITADPNAPEAWFGRAVLLRKAGRPADAVRDLDRALALRRNWAAAHFERGAAYYALGRYGEAVTDFSAALSQNPDDAAALLNRGLARSAQGASGARSDFDRAIRIAPEWGPAYAARASWHEAEGRIEAANADYLRAYELGVTDPALIERVRRMSGG